MGFVNSFREHFTWGRAGSIVFFSLFILMFLAWSGNNSDLERTQEQLSQAEQKLEEARSGSLTVVNSDIISPNAVVTRMEAEPDDDVTVYHVKLVNAGEEGTVKLKYRFLAANRTALAAQNQTVHMEAGAEKTVDLRYSSPDDSETWRVSTSDADSEEFRAQIFNTATENEVNITLSFFDSSQELLKRYSKQKNIPTDSHKQISFYIEPPKNFESYRISADYAS